MVKKCHERENLPCVNKPKTNNVDKKTKAWCISYCRREDEKFSSGGESTA